MFKIKKGIKKKIKGKKDKEDSELFTPEEYERYKKQKEEEAKSKLEAQHIEDKETLSDEPYIEQVEQEEESVLPEEEEEEITKDNCQEESEKKDWKNFFSATDTVLKKTTVNLEHIKESSFYQVKKPEELVKVDAPENLHVSVASEVPQVTKGWVNLDKGGIDENSEEEVEEYTETNNTYPEEVHEHKEPKEFKEIVLKPLDELPTVAAEDYADVFDTTFVDNIESGEVQLFEIPEIPENLNEPDPFDTSDVDKVLHIEEEKEETKEIVEKVPKKKKKLVNLGCAVDVLTGKAAPPKPSKHTSSRIVKEINLLADSDVTEENPSNEELEKEQQNKDKQEEETNPIDEILFNQEENCDLPDIIEIPINTCKSENKLENDADPLDINSCEEKLESAVLNASDDLYELLDPLAGNKEKETSENSHLKDLVEEFDLINKGDNTKLEYTVVKSDAIDDNIKDEFDAEFAVLAAVSIAKDKEKEIEELGKLDDDDPFDTSVVQEVLGKTDDNTTLKETEEYECDNEQINNSIIYTKKPPRPIPPATHSRNTSPKPTEEEEDPFDTSAINDIVTSDPFDIIEHNISLPDTLKPDSGENRPTSEDLDPFDTTFADSFGKTELKVLEVEFLSDITKEEDLDFDFNPREGEPEDKSATVHPESPVCFLTTNEKESDQPVLAPQAASVSDELDPFDTSIADNVEIKGLEAELLGDTKTDLDLEINECSSGQLLSLLNSEDPLTTKTDEDFDPFDTSIANQFEIKSESNEDNKEVEIKEEEKDLDLKLDTIEPENAISLLAATPIDENPTLEPKPLDNSCNFENQTEEDDIDPFDTSIADQFGKTELKALESELLSQTDKTQVDNEFDPRAVEIVKNSEKIPSPVASPSPVDLLTDNIPDDVQQLPPLSPLLATNGNSSQDLDPFDTSIANTYKKVEIKKLESELLSDINSSQINYKTFNQRNFVQPSFQNKVIEPEQTNNLGEITEIDPFDTSIADKFGSTEVKSLETASLADSGTKRVLSDDEFDPREEEIKLPKRPLTPKNTSSSILDSQIALSDQSLPILQATAVISVTEDEIDPFDTSIADQIGPSKAELSLLDKELLGSN